MALQEWNKWPWEKVNYISLETFKHRLDKKKQESLKNAFAVGSLSTPRLLGLQLPKISASRTNIY